MPGWDVPDWVVYAAIGGVVLVVVGLFAISRVIWRRQVRRYLTGLIGRRESARAGLDGMRRVLASLSEADDGQLVAFSADPSLEERRSIGELGERMRIEASELEAAALPKRLWTLADRLQAVASAIADQADKIGEAGDAEAVLEVLADVDLVRLAELLDAANEELGRLSAMYGIEDAAVYGGGLYI